MSLGANLPQHVIDLLPVPDSRPVLIVPYMWIGDFVRCHSVVRLLKTQNPERAVDVLTSSNTAPLVDYMPGIRQGIVFDLPRKKLPLGLHRRLAERLKAGQYGQALIMPRTWKAAFAPFLAGIPVRTGFVGEARFGLINDLRFGERRLPRMIDRCAALALAPDEALPADWPLPKAVVPPAAIAAFRQRIGATGEGRPVVAFAPGAVGPSKRWPGVYFTDLAQRLLAERCQVWVIGGPGEKDLAREIAGGERHIRDLTGPDLRNAILALAAADVAVSNDSGLLHVAAALSRPAIGIFGPTSPYLWAPLNPVAAIVEPAEPPSCRPCHKPVCRLKHHRCMRDITVERVLEATRAAMPGATETRAVGRRS